MTAAVRTSKHKKADPAKASTDPQKSSSGSNNKNGFVDVTKPPKLSPSALAEEHLPPMSLVFCVLLFSGSMFVLGLRDALATGKNIVGPLDDAYLQFTDSKTFFDESQGWKSTQGGLSAIAAVTTDANNMGGLFVRKMGGAAAAMVHMQKLLPILFHPDGAEWLAGHFRPLYCMAICANLALAIFYGSYMEDFVAADAGGLPKFMIAILGMECLVLAFHLFTTKPASTKRPAVAMPDGKTPDSITSRIVTRTVVVVSSVMAMLLLRDLFAPGFIYKFVPRDDIYLEWTNAFIHSPPQGTPEAHKHGMESALFVGDKFVSQFMALHMLILCAYKFLTAFGIKFGSDGSGLIKCRMIWKTQCIGDFFFLLLMRIFSSAALTASLDLRWHLMMVGYEAFILGLYAWF